MAGDFCCVRRAYLSGVVAISDGMQMSSWHPGVMGAWEGYVQGSSEPADGGIGVARMNDRIAGIILSGAIHAACLSLLFLLPAAKGVPIKTFHIRFEQRETFSAEAQKPVTSTKEKTDGPEKGAGRRFESGGKKADDTGRSGK